MKSCEYIWIFGLSAVGKKTLIIQSQNENLKTNKYLNILNLKQHNKIIIPIVIPANHKKNRRIFFMELLKNNFTQSVVLIHGQWVDIQWDILSELKKKYPDKFNRCFFIKKRKKLNEEEESMILSLKTIFSNIKIIKSFIPKKLQKPRIKYDETNKKK